VPRVRNHFSTEASLFTVLMLIAVAVSVALLPHIGFSAFTVLPAILIWVLLLGNQIRVGPDQVVIRNTWRRSSMDPVDVASYGLKPQERGVQVLTLTLRSGQAVEVEAVRCGVTPFRRFEQRRADRVLLALRSVVPAVGPVDNSER
jgi:hypothetical protein